MQTLCHCHVPPVRMLALCDTRGRRALGQYVRRAMYCACVPCMWPKQSTCGAGHKASVGAGQRQKAQQALSKFSRPSHGIGVPPVGEHSGALLRRARSAAPFWRDSWLGTAPQHYWSCCTRSMGLMMSVMRTPSLSLMTTISPRAMSL